MQTMNAHQASPPQQVEQVPGSSWVPVPSTAWLLGLCSPETQRMQRPQRPAGPERGGQLRQRAVRLALLAQAALFCFLLGRRALDAYHRSGAADQAAAMTLTASCMTGNATRTNCSRSSSKSSSSGCDEQPVIAWPEVHHLYHQNRTLFGCRREVWGGKPWFDNSSDAGSELIGTSYAQNWLHKHQHPQVCEEAKFLVNRPHRTGIGSQVHVMGAFLAAAIEMERVYIEAYGNGTTYIWGGYCRKRAPLSECFYEPFTHCTLAHAGYNASSTAWWKPGEDQWHLRTLQSHETLEWDSGESRMVPRAFASLLEASRIRPDQYYAWWRAQAAAFMVRPNARTLRKLGELRAKHFGGRQLQPGTISVHVRHGDKKIETFLVTDDTYWNLTRTVQRNHSGLLRRSVFLSTEDGQTVEYFENQTRTAEGAGWELLLTDTPRQAGAFIGSDKVVSTLDMAKKRGPSREYLWSLLNLQLALEADAWVGTLTSNWCRLIDELRATVRCKAERPYHDAQYDAPPYNLGWR